MRNWHPAAFHKDLIPIGMIAVVMRIKSKSYRLVRQGAYFADDQSCPRRKIRIDHQDVVFKNDPTVVANCVRAIRHMALVKIDVRRHEIRLRGLCHSCGNWPGRKLSLRRET